jgi:hypothetical protein
LSNRRVRATILMIVLFAGLAAVIGIYAYRLGQQHPIAANLLGGSDATSVATTSPSATQTRIPPPSAVTNTPTPTSSPTVTPAPTQTPTHTPSPSPTPTPTPIVVITHIKSLGRLETTEFAMRTIIDLENEPSNVWENIFGTDRLMLVAEGEVVAGLDLSKVEPENIVVRGATVNITLPQPEILYSRIDNERTFVYERKTGLFRKIDKTLESRARQLAEQSMVDWAVQRDIYSKAADSAQIRIENLLRSLGFTEIVIQFKSEPL